jgi:hypothetical protein
MLKIEKIFAFAILAIAFAMSVQRGMKTTYARLPNGMNIGYQALIDLSTPYLKPDTVPKYENGVSLLPGDAWPFFATETTVYGLAEGKDHNSDFWFAWREDTGLILKKNNPEEYGKLVSEAGELLEHTEYGMFSSHIVMRNLKKHPEYKNQTCRTRLLTW